MVRLGTDRGGPICEDPSAGHLDVICAVDVFNEGLDLPWLDTLKRYYEDFTLPHGARPRALEALHDGYNPHALRRQTGSWLGFVASVGGLDAEQARTHDRHRAFRGALETTAMTRSYKTGKGAES
jgi:hypothetical protein